MLLPFFLIGVSLLLLFAGAEILVRGSSSLALRCGISPLVVGLTVVAFGTSSPELLVSLKAALAGKGDIATGNVVGSNIFNIGMILGLTAAVSPVSVKLQLIKADVPVMALVCGLVPLLFWDGALGRGEGIALCGGLLAYLIATVYWGRKEGSPALKAEFEKGVPKASAHWLVDVVFIAGGLAVLIVGSRLLVDGSVDAARLLGVSEAVVGLTIISAGTSMPELATSVVAALRREPDIALGNVVGSNIFNVLAILGVAGAVAPLESAGIGPVDYAVMIGLVVLLMPLLWTGLVLRRWEGFVLLLIYGSYMAWLWPK